MSGRDQGAAGARLAAAAVALALGAGALGWVGTARADYYEGLTAYERQDYAVARTELEPLAQQGDRRAQRLLGTLYAEGHGVAQDFVAAHRWYNLAAAAGDPEAPGLRDQIARQMTPEQLAQAQAQAAAWSGSPATAPQPTYTPAKMVVSADTTGYVAQNYAGPLAPAQIRQLQRELASHGYAPGGADGVIGAKTRAAIRHYQADAGLQVTGEADGVLLQHILVTTPPVRNAATGGGTVKKTVVAAAQPKLPIYRPLDEVNHAYVISIQEELAAKGYPVGSVDGAVGPKTRNAISLYQQRAGLQVTGEPSLELLNHIRLIGAP